jgi:hypothetical protein
MNKNYLFFGLLAYLWASYGNSATCPITAENIGEKVKWVLAEENRVQNKYYQACLKGDNSREAVKKFIECKENPKECQPRYCENYCPGQKASSEPKVEQKITPDTAELSCEGGTLNNGEPTCSGPVDKDPNKISLLSFNLYWWHEFDPLNQHGGQLGERIMKNIRTRMLPADLMAFQETSDIRRVLQGIGLGCYPSYDAGHAVALAWNPEKFEKLSANRVLVGLDQGYDRWNANRVLGFVRLKVKATGQTILFANIHGVLGVNTGGIPIRSNCEYLAHGDNKPIKDSYALRNKKAGGNSKTFAQNIVDVLKANTKAGDIMILAGDFNIDKDNQAESPLQEAFDRITAEWVDKIFINKEGKAMLKDIQVDPFFHNTGSDHRALRVVFTK